MMIVARFPSGKSQSAIGRLAGAQCITNRRSLRPFLLCAAFERLHKLSGAIPEAKWAEGHSRRLGRASAMSRLTSTADVRDAFASFSRHRFCSGTRFYKPQKLAKLRQYSRDGRTFGGTDRCGGLDNSTFGAALGLGVSYHRRDSSTDLDFGAPSADQLAVPGRWRKNG